MGYASRVNAARISLHPTRMLPILALVAANLVPLAGVAFFGWSLFELLLIYWLENGVIGGYNLLRMATVRGGAPSPFERIGRMLFFGMHYGIFWVVHGVFVVSLFGGGMGPVDGFARPGAGGLGQGLGMPGLGMPGLDMPGLGVPGPGIPAAGTILLGALSLVASHGVSFVQNWLIGGERERVGLEALMAQPYSRVVVLHLTILGGGFAAAFLGSPFWALLLLVALKTGVDVAAHRREHDALG